MDIHMKSRSIDDLPTLHAQGLECILFRLPTSSVVRETHEMLFRLLLSCVQRSQYLRLHL